MFLQKTSHNNIHTSLIKIFRRLFMFINIRDNFSISLNFSKRIKNRNRFSKLFCRIKIYFRNISIRIKNNQSPTNISLFYLNKRWRNSLRNRILMLNISTTLNNITISFLTKIRRLTRFKSSTKSTIRFRNISKLCIKTNW